MRQPSRRNVYRSDREKERMSEAGLAHRNPIGPIGVTLPFAFFVVADFD